MHENGPNLSRRHFIYGVAAAASLAALPGCGVISQFGSTQTPSGELQGSDPNTEFETPTPSEVDSPSPTPHETPSQHPTPSEKPTQSASPSHSASPDGTPPASEKPRSSATAPENRPYVKTPFGRLPSNHFIESGPSDKRRVAISIDDFLGINGADYLDGLLSVSESTGVKFTMFPTGASLALHTQAHRNESWQKAAADGHVIGNHTYDHVDLSRQSTQGIRNQLSRTHDALENALGSEYPATLMRPPYGAGGFPDATGAKSTPLGRDHNRVMKTVQGMGYFMTMWTVDSNVTVHGQTQVVTKREDPRFIKKIMKDPYEHVRNGSIILLHPTTLSIKGVRTLIHKLEDKNYDITTVPGLFKKH